MKVKILRFLLVLILLLPACAFLEPGYTPSRLKAYKPLPELINYPVIDVHAHTFNARYLPIRNIIRARRVDFPQLANANERDLLRVGDFLIWVTRRAHFSRESLDRLEMTAAQTGDAVTPLQAVSRNLVTLPENDNVHNVGANVSTPIFSPPGGPIPPSSSDLRQFVQLMLPEERRAQESLQKAVSAHSGVEPVVRFLGFLTSSEKRLAHELSATEFSGRVRLFVNHTMDLGPVFGESPDGEHFLDFQTQQLPRVRELDRDMNGKFLHFVAWNPYRRPNDPTLALPRPLSIVREAVQRGAWGVKFYPPSGYRPAGNDIPAPPAPGELRNQWNARYAMISGASIGELDARLDAINDRLFAWAEKNRIPIFSHSAGGEFNAAKEYGHNNAHPIFWRTVLSRHPRLRLCLAHAGGPDFWFHRNIVGDGGWGREAYELCTTYRNVYCEFGAEDEILDAGERDAFARRIADLVQQSSTSRPYHFADKIMYGSDWFMPTRAAPRTLYLDMYREAFLRPDLKGTYKNFFCRNAMRYLRLEDRLDTQANVTTIMRANLRKLIADSKK